MARMNFYRNAHFKIEEPRKDTIHLSPALAGIEILAKTKKAGISHHLNNIFQFLISSPIKV